MKIEVPSSITLPSKLLVLSMAMVATTGNNESNSIDHV